MNEKHLTNDNIPINVISIIFNKDLTHKNLAGTMIETRNLTTRTALVSVNK